MNLTVFNQKIESLKRFEILNEDDIIRFGEIIKGLSDWDIFRINPISFAKIYSFNTNSIIDIFVHSVKIGLFDFNWNLLCPMCGGIEFSLSSMNNIEGDTFHCTTCNLDVSTNIDDQVEVSFTVNQIIKELEVDPYLNIESYFKYFFSKNYKMSNEFSKYLFNELLIDYYVVDPDESKIISYETKPNTLYRFLSIQTHSCFYIQTGDNETNLPLAVEVDLLSSGFSPNEVSVDYGKVNFHIHNRSKYKIGMILMKVDFSITRNLVKLNPTQKFDFLTGKGLLNNQSFRDLFRVQNLSRDLKLNIRSLTIMFTDLKGSTEMYDKAGDYRAYNLVQKHFDILINSVRKYSGAIIKTMGDAIMATFSSPNDGLLASFDMMKNIDKMNNEWEKIEGHEIGLKIGLNEGAALAVNADERLDYFGQSVNVAARIQGLASSGEIWVSESIYNNFNENNFIESIGYKTEKQSAILKGVGKPTPVYKIFR